MRKLFTLLFGLITVISYSQIEHPKDPTGLTLSFSLENIPAGLQIISPRFEANKLILKQHVEIIDGDLVLTTEFLSPEIKRKRIFASKEYYQFRPKTVINQNGMALIQDKRLLKTSNQRIDKKRAKNTILVKDFTEANIFPGNTYQLIYDLEPYISYPAYCNKDYSFKFKQHLPYIGGVLASGWFFWKGANTRQDAIEDNSAYVDAWINGAESPVNDMESQEDITRKEYQEDINGKITKYYTWGGIILATTVLTYTFHRILRGSKKKWKEHCTQNNLSFQIQPSVDFSNPYLNPQSIGLGIAYSF